MKKHCAAHIESWEGQGPRVPSKKQNLSNTVSGGFATGERRSTRAVVTDVVRNQVQTYQS
jgi:hypothetical protein